MKKKIKIIGIIPAHLNSIRFPNKIIHKIFDIPMIEHVRRRAKLAKYLDNRIKNIPGLIIQELEEGSTHAYYVYPIKYIENGAAKSGTGEPMATYDFTWMWQELGLVDFRR